MSLTRSLIRFLAARFHVPSAALDYFFASAHIGRGAETALPFPAELIPIGARLVLRGWRNNKFFPTNRDWILPYWAERQFDPRAPGFLPRGLNLYTINYTHRDWTMIGNARRAREAIVDPRGLVTPWFDGWSLDAWIEVDGRLFAPSRLADGEIEQSLHENLPSVVTTFRAQDLRVRLESFATEQDAREFVAEPITVTNLSRDARCATLYLAIRPFNPEGVALVRDIAFHSEPTASSLILHAERSSLVIVNRALGVLLPRPDAIACSNFDAGDIALVLPDLNGKTRVHCDAGLATAVAAYRFELGAGESKTLTALMPMEREELDEDELPITNYQLPISNLQSLISNTVSNWREDLSHGMRIRVPDEKLQAAFDANKAYLLLLHDGDTITPGPFTYHQFWFRDAAYLLNALDQLGYHDEARQVIEKFPRRIRKDGYAHATEGEWDSNGAAIWAMVEHARLSGNTTLLARDYWSLLKMASWINSKRRRTKDKRKRSAVSSQQSLHHGLLPPGPSAEHLGPSDYFYWDDFWGLAGLREAARAADWLGQKSDAEKLRANFESFRADVDASLAGVAARIGRAAMPASPYRRLDAGMIGSLAALYPLRLFDARDPRIVDTLAALKEIAWMEDAYFNHVGHSAFGTYLSLHVAQCLLFQRDADAWKTINWVLRHASPTFTWAEGIHPLTRRGGMGDGHHGWALADFLLAVRNALLFEEDDHLVLTPALPEDWCAEMNAIKVEHAPTYFGNLNFTIAFGERDATLVVNGDWRAAPEYIEWNLPFALRDAGGDADGIEIIGNAARLPRGATRVVVTW
ncbi:MAG: hypothetical protein FJ009_16040 [Chloroflexi bacterium]|nr:hypothetical protein [Chloroflexota bacterium]